MQRLQRPLLENEGEYTNYPKGHNSENPASNKIGLKELRIDAFDRRYWLPLLAVMTRSFDRFQFGSDRPSRPWFLRSHLGSKHLDFAPEASKLFILMTSLCSLCPPLADALFFSHALILADVNYV